MTVHCRTSFTFSTSSFYLSLSLSFPPSSSPYPFSSCFSFSCSHLLPLVFHLFLVLIFLPPFSSAPLLPTASHPNVISIIVIIIFIVVFGIILVDASTITFFITCNTVCTHFQFGDHCRVGIRTRYPQLRLVHYTTGFLQSPIVVINRFPMLDLSSNPASVLLYVVQFNSNDSIDVLFALQRLVSSL